MQLAYGHSHIDFFPPDSVAWQVLGQSPAGKAVAISLASVVQNLTDQLAERHLKKGKRLLLVIPDHTRRCRVDEILPVLLAALMERFQPYIEILIANGSHVLQPEETIRELVGEEVYESFPVQQHDSRDASSLVSFGLTTNGTPIFLNHKVKDADFVITIGGVLFHYFAGFGGGPKMLLPGVAGYETIRLNHRLTVDESTASFHSGCREGNLDGNPVFEDLAQIAKLAVNVISLQVVLNPQKEFVFAEAGPMMAVHRRACEHVRKTFSLPLKQKADVVVASAGGFPSDVNLIQSHKSIHHAFQAVKENGFVIILAECREGIGSKTCMPYFDAGDSLAIGRRLLQDYQINGHTALALKMKAEKAAIYFISSLEPELVAKTGMIPKSSLELVWQEIQPKISRNATGYIMPKASIYSPVPEG